MPRGRPPKTLEPAPPVVVEAIPVDGAEVPAVRRRRRRRTAAPPPDYAGETVALVEAALKSRGSRGATQETLQSVVDWARGVRAEGDEIKTFSIRPRRLKAQAPAERMARYEMNRALLDGVLAGTIALDVDGEGGLVFIHSAHAGGANAGEPVEISEQE